MEQLVYVYDGSYDGILSCVFEAYANRERPDELATEFGLQMALMQKTRHIQTDFEQARRVEQGFEKKAGKEALEIAQTIFFSGSEDKGTIMFRYFVVGLTVGWQIRHMLADSAVADAMNLLTEVNREVHLFYGLVRFSKLENGVFFARISPKCSAVPMLMPFFVDRYSVQPFVIYDSTHQMAGFYDREHWQLVETSEIILPDLAEGEEDWIHLWRTFFHAISIVERENLSFQRSHCPKRFWGNLPEMQNGDPRLQHKTAYLSQKTMLEIES